MKCPDVTSSTRSLKAQTCSTTKIGRTFTGAWHRAILTAATNAGVGTSGSRTPYRLAGRKSVALTCTEPRTADGEVKLLSVVLLDLPGISSADDR